MKFKRILLKLSGEALAGEKGHGIDNQILSDMASESQAKRATVSIIRFFLTWPPKLHPSSSRVCKSLS